MPEQGFSIELGPELDPPYTLEWGHLDESLPALISIRARRKRSFKAMDRQRERLYSRKNRGPKHIPERELPEEHEVAMEGKPVRVLDPVEEFAQDVSLDALQEIAQQTTERHAA